MLKWKLVFVGLFSSLSLVVASWALSSCSCRFYPRNCPVLSGNKNWTEFKSYKKSLHAVESFFKAPYKQSSTEVYQLSKAFKMNIPIRPQVSLWNAMYQTPVKKSSHVWRKGLLIRLFFNSNITCHKKTSIAPFWNKDGLNAKLSAIQKQANNPNIESSNVPYRWINRMWRYYFVSILFVIRSSECAD